MNDVSLELMAKYPFLDESREYLSDKNPIEVIKDTKDEKDHPVLKAAKRRIYVGIQSGTAPRFKHNETDEKGGVFNQDEENVLLSYPIARILVSIFDEIFVIKQYARAEAKAAIANLQQDIDNESEDDLSEFGVDNMARLTLDDIKEKYKIDFEKFTDIKTLVNNSQFVKELEKNDTEQNIKILQSIGGKVSQNENQLENITQENAFLTLSTYFFNQLETDQKYPRYYTITLKDYLRLTKDKSEVKWNLPNRILFDGNIIITEYELFELIEEVFFNDIYETLPLDVPSDIEDLLKDDLDDIESFIPNELVFEDINIVEEGLFPPVIKTILERIKQGKSVVHEERITLATFLIHIGMSDDEIIDLLEVHSDFDENTRYQLQHLRTKGEGGEPYTPPTYSTLRAWGIEWDEDELEQKVSHPLGYYRIKLSSMGKLDKDEEDQAIDDEISNE